MTITNESQKGNKQVVYKVTTCGDIEGKTSATLGYATGKIEDIEQFFKGSKIYKLWIEPIKVIKVTQDLIIRVPEKKHKYRELREELIGLEKEVEEWYAGD